MSVNFNFASYLTSCKQERPCEVVDDKKKNSSNNWYKENSPE